MVEGLAHQLEMVASNVKALVQMRTVHNSSDPEGSTRQMINPLFEDNGGIQTRAVRLDFPKFHGEDPSGGCIELINSSITIKPIRITESYWHPSIWKGRP